MDIKRWPQESRQIVQCSPTVVLRATKTLYTSKPTDSSTGAASLVAQLTSSLVMQLWCSVNRIMVVRKPNDNQQNMKCTIKPDDKLGPSKGQDQELPWKAMEGVLKNHCDGIVNR
ncbi:unnamed protein product [Sphenostylis stenocarpa]|uniref:Uncharacterized protein n=1 Tax=Sphenostylis stenocarpa TaxID=92480 RepID=A0AA86VLZ5_9FABA|nr:unnamed protein product [Sphenostylis stenocarpa]